MNAEELKQLKKGDEIFIRAKFKTILDDGDVTFTRTHTNLDDDVVKAEEYTHPDNIILPPSAPKYDPFRLFKKRRQGARSGTVWEKVLACCP